MTTTTLLPLTPGDAQAAIVYARGVLHGRSTLDTLLAERLGSFSARGVIVGAGATMKPGHDFRHGGVTRRYLTEPLIAAFVRDALATTPRGLALFPAPHARPIDAAVTRAKLPFITVDSGLYYVARTGDPAERVRAVTRAAANFGWTIAIMAADASPASGASFSAAELAPLAERTHTLLVDAFDGEAALVLAR